ncbi:AAA family ATPase [Tabrizicola soli]|uniref:AAA family ATPase n=1 Tax=Tabrizicola soli TaxID=2185115 RepID=UPI0018D2852F|nr:AAA family ATPase [Tabrizicola soli]
MAVLKDAARRDLIDPAEAAQVEGNYITGLLTQDGLKARLLDALRVGPAARLALDAIAPAYAPGDVIELRALDPAGGGAVSLNGRLDNPAERAALMDFIRQHNGRRNLYVGINPRRLDMAGTGENASAQDVVARRTVVLDLDHKDAPDADQGWTRTVDALRAELDPLMVVDSGNGVHVWLPVENLSGPDVVASAAPLAAAMARLGADHMADAPRIIRLPFTVNLPNASKRARGAVMRIAAPLPDTKPNAPSARPAPLPVAQLCRGMEGVATQLGLPGRGKAMAAASPSRVASDGGAKTPHPAPSADVLQLALAELPNDPGGPFEARGAWVDMAHAIKGASIAGGIEAEGREAFVQWSQKWGTDADDAGRVWDGIADPHTGWGAVMRTLEAVNPAGAERVKHAAARAAFAQDAARISAVILSATFAPVASITGNRIPPRRWLYGRSVIAGFLSFLIAPGGAGKSALAMVRAVAMAAGRELLEGEKPVRPLRVWVHNAEDDLGEMERRLAATLQHFGMFHADLNDNLFMTSGRGMKLQLARTGRDGPEIVPGVVDALVERLVTTKLDVLILDPLGALHTLPENSNEAANLLSGALREVAHRADVAVVVLHHAGKAAAMDMDAAGAGASRGASAFVDAARVVEQVVRMTTDDAKNFGIAAADRRDYLRVENGKANLARAEGGRWLRMADVPLGNGVGLWPLGDRVGVVESWTPKPVTGTPTDLARVQAALMASSRPLRADQRSPEWIGWKVAEVMGLNTGGPSTSKEDRTPDQATALARVRAIVAGWVQSGGLVERQELDADTRKKHRFVFIGQPAIVLDTDAVDSPSDKDGADDDE